MSRLRVKLFKFNGDIPADNVQEDISAWLEGTDMFSNPEIILQSQDAERGLTISVWYVPAPISKNMGGRGRRASDQPGR